MSVSTCLSYHLITSYSQKTVFRHYGLSPHPLILDTRKYLYSMRLVMTILTICVSNFCDHWMVSYRELIFLRNTIVLLIFIILHFKDFNRTPFLLTIEI